MEQFTFFWRTKSPFSQWHRSVFSVDGVQYTTAEQYMMAEKARLFNDVVALKKIFATDDPRTQKALGRQIKGYSDTVWNKVARNKVYIGNHAKFTRNAMLLKKLLETKGTTLVEASPTDKKWGIGLDENDERAKKRETWQGANWLGEVLTVLRDDIINDTVDHKRFLNVES